MTTREEINARLRRTTIKGRDYIDVAQRIDGFWALYPDGRIVTKMLNDSGSRCTFRATCYDGRGEVIATGHAFEDRKGTVNQTSYIENCETSAIGRALGNAGIGSTEQVASADEVRWAMEQQEAGQPVPAPVPVPVPAPAPDRRAAYIERADSLRELCVQEGIKPEGIDSWAVAALGTSDPTEMDEARIVAYGQHLNQLIKDKQALKERV